KQSRTYSWRKRPSGATASRPSFVALPEPGSSVVLRALGPSRGGTEPASGVGSERSVVLGNGGDALAVVALGLVVVLLGEAEALGHGAEHVRFGGRKRPVGGSERDERLEDLHAELAVGEVEQGAAAARDFEGGKFDEVLLEHAADRVEPGARHPMDASELLAHPGELRVREGPVGIGD